MLVGVWAILATLLLHTMSKGATKSVSSQKLIDLFNRDEGCIVDIRPQADFDKGHITGSNHIPLAKLSENNKQLENSKTKPIIVVCNAGIQANGACALLKKQGFEQVFKLQGGMQGWLADNLPIART